MTWASGCRRSSCTWIVSAWARAPAVFGNGFPRIPAVSQSPSTIRERRKLLVSIFCLRSIRVQSSLPALHSQPVRSSAFSRLWLVSTITAMKKWKKLDALGPISFPFSFFTPFFLRYFFSFLSLSLLLPLVAPKQFITLASRLCSRGSDYPLWPSECGSRSTTCGPQSGLYAAIASLRFAMSGSLGKSATTKMHLAN